MKLNINGSIIEIEDSVMIKAIEDKQDSIEIKSELVIRTAADETIFADNTRREGISTGAEIGRKEVLKGFGLDGEGLHKTHEASITALKGFSDGLVAKALEDAKIAPDKKVSELQVDITTLKGTIGAMEEANKTVVNDFRSFKNNQLKVSSLSGEIPENTINSKKDILTLMNASINLDVNEYGVVFGVGTDGQPMKDPTTLELLPVKSIAANFFNERGDLLKKSSGGGAGGDSGDGAGKQSVDDFIKEMDDAGHNANSVEFNNIMQERIKAGTIDM